MKSNIHNYIKSIVLLSVISCLGSCSKLLDEKPDQAISTITSIKDLKALINFNDVFNNLGISLGDLGADEYVLFSSAYDQLPVEFQNAYRWDSNTELDAWSQHYVIVYHSNVVLQELNRLTDGTAAERESLKGQALFFRALSFYQLAQYYCKPYSTNAPADLGIPLRLTANVEEKITRSTIEQTYQRIIGDLEEALSLLPMKYDTVNHPGKLSCYGLLARTYLSMSDYINAEKYAKLYLENSDALLDYNSLDTLANPSIPLTNVENVFLSIYVSLIPSANTTINPSLIDLYDEKDLRKKILFTKNPTDGTYNFKGSYEARESFTSYCGIATDEIYLIRAECLARLNRPDDALRLLNDLLSNRYEQGSFEPISGLSGRALVDLLIIERRKELIFRGTRWSDLRRLNLEGGDFKLNRDVYGTTYALLPNDKRWVWLIPQSVIVQSGIQQNER